MHSKWHIILYGTLIFAGNCLKEILVHSNWHVILCRMVYHPIWNFIFAGNSLKQILMYSFKVACYPK